MQCVREPNGTRHKSNCLGIEPLWKLSRGWVESGKQMAWPLQPCTCTMFRASQGRPQRRVMNSILQMETMNIRERKWLSQKSEPWFVSTSSVPQTAPPHHSCTLLPSKGLLQQKRSNHRPLVQMHFSACRLLDWWTALSSLCSVCLNSTHSSGRRLSHLCHLSFPRTSSFYILPSLCLGHSTSKEPQMRVWLMIDYKLVQGRSCRFLAEHRTSVSTEWYTTNLRWF